MNIMLQEVFDIIPVQTVYCTHCRTVTNMCVTTTLLPVAGAEGNAEMVAVRTYHCESCCSFVKNEEGTILLLEKGKI